MISPTPRRHARGSKPIWKRILRRPYLAAMRVAGIGAGIAYVSPVFQALRSARLTSAVVPGSLRVATVAHVYYPELWPAIRAAHATLPAGARLIVTAPARQAALLAERAAGDPLVDVVEVPNRGRDIAPFLHLLQSGRLDGLDAVLKIHTKRSPHLRDGDLRRRLLYAALAGSRKATASILAQFADPKVGLVGLSWCFRSAPPYWMANRDRVEALAARMEGRPALGFFEGSMFWVRPSALAPLRALRLETSDFEEEGGQLDGALHHAVERVFPIAAAAAGFETRSLGGKTLVAATPPRDAALVALAMQAGLADRACG
ncbi:rhamnan synthesis F family protein [Enterovirga rhinocerotis]|uniref:Rhamnan synthesis protein F n=1 Tax=Enterovirga rhinocerotis TaxID=1339210 RepID=A0A4R7BNA8_9HYPH|nr:rhamnan synthesis F family protein [Enterovirga rhinocerotis]TDR85416.1 rhamnan synthesis protein F [Enterovirga rhinocerotis]